MAESTNLVIDVVIDPSKAKQGLEEIRKSFADISKAAADSGRAVGETMAASITKNNKELREQASLEKQIRQATLAMNKDVANSEILVRRATVAMNKELASEGAAHEKMVRRATIAMQKDLVSEAAAHEKLVRQATLMMNQDFAARKLAQDKMYHEAYIMNLEHTARKEAEIRKHQSMVRQAQVMMERDLARQANIGGGAAAQDIFAAAGMKSPMFRQDQIKNIELAKEKLVDMYRAGSISSKEFVLNTREAEKRLNLMTAGDVRARSELHRFLAKTASLTFELTGAFYGLLAASSAIGFGAILGIKFQKEVEVAQLGMTGIITSMGLIEDKSISVGKAWQLSGKYIDLVRQDSIKFGVDMAKLTEVNRAVMAPLLSAGVKLPEIQKFATAGAVAVSALGLGTQQFVQEVRDLATGGITAANSTLATSLGVTNAMVNEWKKNGTFITNMMDRLEGFNKTSEEMLRSTLTGSWDILKAKLGAALQDPEAFKGLVEAINAVSDAIGSPKFKAGVEYYWSFIKAIGSSIKDAVVFINDHADAIKNLAVAYIALRVLEKIPNLFSAISTSILRAAISLEKFAIADTATSAASAFDKLETSTKKYASVLGSIANSIGKAGYIGMILWGIYEVADFFGIIDSIFDRAEARSKALADKKYGRELGGKTMESLYQEFFANKQAQQDLIEQGAGTFEFQSTFDKKLKALVDKENQIRYALAKSGQDENELNSVTGKHGFSPKTGTTPKEVGMSMMAQMAAELGAKDIRDGESVTNLQKVNLAWEKQNELIKANKGNKHELREIEKRGTSAEYAEALKRAATVDLELTDKKLKVIRDQTKELEKQREVVMFGTSGGAAYERALITADLEKARAKIGTAFERGDVTGQASAAKEASAQLGKLGAFDKLQAAKKEVLTPEMAVSTLQATLQSTFKDLASGMQKSWQSVLKSFSDALVGKVIDKMVENAMQSLTASIMGTQTVTAVEITNSMTLAELEKANLAKKAAMDAANANMITMIIMAILVAADQGFKLFSEFKKVSEKTTLGGGLGGLSGSMQTLSVKEAGWYNASELRTENRGLRISELRQYSDAMKDQRQVLINAGDALGYANTASKNLTIAVTAEKDVVAALANNIGQQLTPALAVFRREGEDLTQTAQRMSDTFKGTNDLLTATGRSAATVFGGAGLAGAAGREALVTASGGLDKFNQNASSFIQNFLTPSEKLAPMADAVARMFNKLGVTGVTTTKQFADLVKAQMDVGNTTVVADLLSVSDTFNSLSKAVQETNTQLSHLMDKKFFSTLSDYIRASNSGANIGAALGKANAGLPATLVAERAGTASFTTANAGLIARANTETNAQSVGYVYHQQQSQLDAIIEGIMHAINALIDGLSRLLTNLLEPIVDFFSSFFSDFGNLFSNLGDGLGSALNGLGDELGSAIDGLSRLLTNLFEPIVDFFSSFFSNFGNLFSNLGDEIVTALGSVVSSIGNAAMAIINAVVDGIRSTVSGGNIINGVLDVVTFGSWSSSGASGAANDAWEEVSSWFSDPRLKDHISPTGIQKNGFQLYDFAYKNDPLHTMYRGVMADEVKRVRPDAVHRAANGYDTVDYSKLGLRMERLNSFAVGTNYLPHDMVAQVHEGERIIPKADNSKLMQMMMNSSNNGELIAEIRQLRAELQAGQNAIAYNTSKAYKLMDKWEGVGMPEVREAA